LHREDWDDVFRGDEDDTASEHIQDDGAFVGRE
jgi:hypothetical protein